MTFKCTARSTQTAQTGAEKGSEKGWIQSLSNSGRSSAHPGSLSGQSNCTGTPICTTAPQLIALAAAGRFPYVVMVVSDHARARQRGVTGRHWRPSSANASSRAQIFVVLLTSFVSIVI